MAPRTVLITGANRGLGLGLAKRFLEQLDHTVIAAVRNPDHPTSVALADLPKGKRSQLIVVEYDAAVWHEAANTVKELTEAYSINHLDIVIANAGIAKKFPTVKDVEGSDVLEHVEVNVLSKVSLYQATRDLLQKSTGKPIFAMVGAGAGALGRQPPVPNAVYGASYSMVNWYGVRINAEDEWLISIVLDPGWVQTDMGNAAAQGFGLEEAPVTLDDSCNGMFRVINAATKEKDGGRVVLHTGEVAAW
ncbi:hypothetical protein B0H63DRAFT_456765 [Podospora didyma]|uniref:Aflatoxin biosynthesis ketoreductase nor-1 n=1 Tax=Podospora didyma TaxID=330526 RepID=A0AAE0P3Q2_9PEZI|nr:hypothetical protein B0H63DRAFT_456765 [Podospora didyma]